MGIGYAHLLDKARLVIGDVASKAMAQVKKFEADPTPQTLYLTSNVLLGLLERLRTEITVEVRNFPELNGGYGNAVDSIHHLLDQLPVILHKHTDPHNV